MTNLHERVRARVGRVARLQDVQLLLTQHGSRAGTLPVVGIALLAAARWAAGGVLVFHAGWAAAEAAPDDAHELLLRVDHAHVFVGEVAVS
jgi:hypothetical protein